jgi:hypothetical protein
MTIQDVTHEIREEDLLKAARHLASLTMRVILISKQIPYNAIKIIKYLFMFLYVYTVIYVYVTIIYIYIHTYNTSYITYMYANIVYDVIYTVYLLFWHVDVIFYFAHFTYVPYSILLLHFQICMYIYMPKLLPIHAYIYIYTHCLYVHVYDDMCRVLLLHDSCTFYICMIFHFATFANLCIYIYMCMYYIPYCYIYQLIHIIYIYLPKHISIRAYIYIHCLYVPVYDYMYRVHWLHDAWTIVYHDRAGLNALKIDIDSVCFNPCRSR